MVASLSTWASMTGKLCYLQLFDATGRDVVVEMCLQRLHIGHELHVVLLQVGQPVFGHLGLDLLLSHLGLLKEHLSVLFLLQRLSRSSCQLPDPHPTCGVLMTHSLISDESVCHISKHHDDNTTEMFITCLRKTTFFPNMSSDITSDFDGFLHVFDIPPCAYVPSCLC